MEFTYPQPLSNEVTNTTSADFRQQLFDEWFYGLPVGKYRLKDLRASVNAFFLRQGLTAPSLPAFGQMLNGSTTIRSRSNGVRYATKETNEQCHSEKLSD